MRIERSVVPIAGVILLGSAAVAGTSAYYTAIQSQSTSVVQAERFQAQEAATLSNFTEPEEYRQLVLLFSNTTERVWAVVYAEAYMSMTDHDQHRADVSALLFSLYDNGITVSGDGSVGGSFTKHVEAPRDGALPFEMNFEISLAIALGTSAANPKPLSIKVLSDARLFQLRLWEEKAVPPTSLIRWQRTVAAAGFFEPYNYWLFQSARPREFEAWREQHRQEYDAWLRWLETNRFKPTTPDLQRFYMVHGDGKNAG